MGDVIIIGSDTFIRANNPSSWGTASDGNTYTNTGGGTLTITSDHGTISNAGVDTNMQHGSYTSANMDVLCRITPSNTADVFGVQARYSVAAGNISCYKFLWYGGAIHVNKAVAGISSQLTTVTYAVTANQAYWMRLRVVGSNLTGKIWQDGSAESTATISTTTDTSVTGAGGAALLGNTAASNVIQYDSLTVTDATVTQHTGMRFLQAIAHTQSIGARLRQAISASKAVSSRFVLANAHTQSTGVRFKTANVKIRFAGIRFLQAIQHVSAIGARLRQAQAHTAYTGLRLHSNGSGSQAVGCRFCLQLPPLPINAYVYMVSGHMSAQVPWE